MGHSFKTRLLNGIESVFPSVRSARTASRNGLMPFGRESRKWIALVDAWESSDRLWQLGYYSKAVSLRKNLLADTVALQFGSGPYLGPRVLSAGWVSNIGHLGWLAMYAGALDASLLPVGKRTLTVGPRVGNSEVLQSISHNFEVVELTAASAPIEHPALWPLTERLSMVFDGSQHIDTYELWERYWRSDPTKRSNPIKVSDEYSMSARAELARLGLPEDAKFVTLHIRSADDPFDPRLAPIATFIPSVKYLLGLGLHVVHFGSTRMPDLVEQDTYVNLTGLNDHLRSLELYLLNESQFLLTTVSGPSGIAWMLDTPVLQTNTSSIGRNICASGHKSIFLPKHHSYSGSKLTLSQILDSQQGYWEPSSLKEIPEHARPTPNTGTEILAAVSEMLDLIESENISRSSVSMAVNEIRKAHGAVSFGKISESFLESHGKWFLH